jgi:hypothetical protein
VTSIAIAGSTTVLVGVGYPNRSSLGGKGTSFALHLVAGKWRTEHVKQLGKYTNLVSVAVSSKSAEAVGSWATLPHCTIGSVTQALIEHLKGSSWHQSTAPEVRFGVAQLGYRAARPNVPAC